MLALLAVAALAQEEVPREYGDFRGYIDRARFFVRKKWYDDALIELEEAVRTPNGRLDPEVWHMLATVRYELADLEGARSAAERAWSYSRNDEQLQVSAGFATFLRDQFGVVEIRGPYSDLSARLDITLESVIFDPNLKLYLGKVQDQHRRKVSLPRRIGLPAGTYRINGEQVVVEPGAHALIELAASELGGTGPAGTQLAQAEIAMGMSTWTGTAVDNLYPTVSTQLAYSQPIGPLVGGVMLDWTPQSFRTAQGDASSAVAWTLGGRVGVLLPGTGAFVVRPSAGYRYGYVPGIELSCDAIDGGFSCRGDDEADMLVYAVGRAHIPMVELAVDYLDRKRTTTAGVGVKAVVEHAVGTLPAEASARRSEGTAVHYAVESPRGWSATGVRLLANVSLAF